jgi:TRAP-type C4-dicarboxylate transport system permease small subunit
MTLLDRLLRWIELPIHALLWVVLVAGFLMMVHVTVDVTGRTVFNHPFAGTTEIVSAYYMVAAAYLPWAWIARNDGHIVVDLFTRAAPLIFRQVLDLVVKLVTLAWVLLFAYQTGIRAIQQTRAGEVWEAAGDFLPVWPSRWMLPIAGGLMALYLALRIIKDMASLRRGEAGA